MGEVTQLLEVQFLAGCSLSGRTLSKIQIFCGRIWSRSYILGSFLRKQCIQRPTFEKILIMRINFDKVYRQSLLQFFKTFPGHYCIFSRISYKWEFSSSREFFNFCGEIIFPGQMVIFQKFQDKIPGHFQDFYVFRAAFSAMNLYFWVLFWPIEWHVSAILISMIRVIH